VYFSYKTELNHRNRFQRKELSLNESISIWCGEIHHMYKLILFFEIKQEIIFATIRKSCVAQSLWN
jgi:hypothetical protein